MVPCEWKTTICMGCGVKDVPFLAGGFKHFLCSSLFGEDFQFD